MNFEESSVSVLHDTRVALRSRSQLNSLPEKDPSLRDLLRIFHRRHRRNSKQTLFLLENRCR